MIEASDRIETLENEINNLMNDLELLSAMKKFISENFYLSDDGGVYFSFREDKDCSIANAKISEWLETHNKENKQ